MRWDKQDDVKKSSLPANYLKENEINKFIWSIICYATENTLHGKILEMYYKNIVKIDAATIEVNTINFSQDIIKNCLAFN